MHPGTPESTLDAPAALVEERARIARELHDDVAQLLFALKLDCARMAQCGARDPALALRQLKDIEQRLDAVTHSVRRIAVGLRPRLLQQQGLLAAMRTLTEEFSERTGIPCELHLPEKDDITEPYASTVFRIVQECFSNIAKHAGASRAELHFRLDDAVMSVQVRDDGLGFSPRQAHRPDAMGLVGMQERVQLLDGKLLVRSEPGCGTRVIARIPLRQGVHPSTERDHALQ